jgi:FxsC-like protein
MSNPWFFLSYSRSDASDPHLKTFYRNLVGEVRRIADLKNQTDAEIGFLDTVSIETSTHWQEKVAGALRTCRVMVCMYSRGFFNSPFCGKEFQAFKSRVEEYMRASGKQHEHPPLIIPVFWDRPARFPEPLPGGLIDIQYTDDKFSGKYAVEGLYHLIKVHKPEYQSEYNEVSIRLAELIVQQAEAHPLPTPSAIKPFAEIESAFHANGTRNKQPAHPESCAAGPSVAQFIYVAGRRHEYTGIRTKVDCYGEGGPAWQPYYPELKQPVGIMSQSIATTEGLLYEPSAIGQDFLNRLREAEEKNNIVIIVVDPWSIQVETYQNHMLELDRKTFINCGVLIPWNENDGETPEKLNLLQSSVAKTFKRRFILNTNFRGAIRSPGELQREICNTINDVRRSLLRKAEIEQHVGGQSGLLPSLQNVP